jgi:glycosyltransferase involved in cell wall biosynthesis
VIGAVVPAYNREENLELLLASLEHQSSSDFHVVVADDGSTDGTAALVTGLARRPLWRDRLTRVSCGPNQGVRTGRARNIGAANVNSGTQVLLMLDTDLVLRPDAIAMLAAAHARHPGRVLFGAVDWLPPVERREALSLVAAGRLDTLRQRIPGPPAPPRGQARDQLRDPRCLPRHLQPAQLAPGPARCGFRPRGPSLLELRVKPRPRRGEIRCPRSRRSRMRRQAGSGS